MSRKRPRGQNKNPTSPRPDAEKWDFSLVRFWRRCAALRGSLRRLDCGAVQGGGVAGSYFLAQLHHLGKASPFDLLLRRRAVEFGMNVETAHLSFLFLF